MLRRVGFAVVALSGAVACGAGVAGAGPVIDFLPYPAAPFGGEKMLPDRQVERVTADGWVLHAAKTQERINVAPPLDSSVTTGEAFGTVTGRVWIDGEGFPELSGAVFEAGYQIGCGVDVSGGVDYDVTGTVGVAPHTTVGMEGGPHASMGVEGGPSAQLAGEAGPEVKVTLPEGSLTAGADAKVKPQVGADATGKAEVGGDATAKGEAGLDAKAEVTPSIRGHLHPGKVTNVALVSMPVDPGFKRAGGGFTGAHLQVNGCAGPVTVRSYVTVSASSVTSVDAVSVYGDAQRIR